MTLFRTLRKKCRAVAVLLTVALSAHGFVPAAASGTTQGLASVPAELTLEQALHVICSASGTRFPAQAPRMRPGDACPLCPGFTGPAVVAPPAQPPAVTDWSRVSVTPAPCRAPETARIPRRALPRAPPHRSFS